MKRRTLLLGGATVAAAGCVTRFLDDDEEAAESGSNRNGSNNQNTTPSNDSTTQTNDTETGDTGGEVNSTPGEQPENTTANETNETNESANQTEQEKKPLPDENDTAIDREQYNSSTERSVEELPSENVQLTATFSEQEDGSIVTTGQATNVSDQIIDFVDIEVLYFDKNETVIGNDLVVVNELDAGETKPWDCQTWKSDIDGDVAQVGGVPKPQNYA